MLLEIHMESEILRSLHTLTWLNPFHNHVISDWMMLKKTIDVNHFRFVGPLTDS